MLHQTTESGPSTFYGVTITTEPDVRISRPEFIAEITDLMRKTKAGSALLPDGRMIVGLQGDDEERPTEISVTLNWISELNERMAAEN